MAGLLSRYTFPLKFQLRGFGGIPSSVQSLQGVRAHAMVLELGSSGFNCRVTSSMTILIFPYLK